MQVRVLPCSQIFLYPKLIVIHVDNPFKSPAILSLCTGMRGLERGVERVLGPTRTIAYVEIEAFVIENLVQQMEQGVLASTPIWSNLKTFPASDFHGKIHGITGGYPCQPFSHAGQRAGTEDPRHLWPFVARIIKKSRPVWCLFENVEGHISLGLDSVLKDLRRLGYQVEVGLFSAAEVGAPHRRNRVFILALENSFVFRMRGLTDGQRSDWKREIQAQEQPTREQQPPIERSGDEHGELANTNLWWKQQWDDAGVGRIGEPASWPSPPGQNQHAWEPSRTIESKLGYVVNGYNYREDLLRMAGNAVVEQQAEFAFRILLAKHGLI